MKKSELKAKFRRYSAEEKWHHYFACKKKIRRLKKEKQELEDYSSMYYKCLIEEADLQTKVTSQKMRWAELKERVGKKFSEETNCKVAIAYRKVLTYMQELEKEYE